MDKVQKIREEVERLQNELIQEREKGYGSDVDDACILELQNVLTYIDSLQEEPKVNIPTKYIVITQGILDYISKYKTFFENNTPNIGDKWYVDKEITYPKVNNGKPVVELINANGEWMRLPHDIVIIQEDSKVPIVNTVDGGGLWNGNMQEEPISEPVDFEKELYKAFGQVKDFTLGMRIAKRFYDIGKNSQEPVSEDLEEAGKKWLSPQLDKSYAAYGETKQMELTHFDGYAMLDAIEFGAQWQQAKNSIPAEYLEEAVNAYIGYAPEVDESSSTYGKRQAFKAGAEWQKQQDSMPISEDVVSVAKHYLYSNILYDDVYVGPPTDKDCIEMFKAGAQWQKQKDQSHLVHEHIDPPTFEEAQGEKKKED